MQDVPIVENDENDSYPLVIRMIWHESLQNFELYLQYQDKKIK
jgi:hypothetical protein